MARNSNLSTSRARVAQRQRERRWRDLLDEWLASGLTQNAFSQQKGFHPVTFSLWKRRLAPWLAERGRSLTRRAPSTTSDACRSTLSAMERRSCRPAPTPGFVEALVVPARPTVTAASGPARSPWLKRYPRASSAETDSSVDGRSTPDAGLELHLRTGHRIRICGPFDPKILAAVIRVAEGTP